MTCKMEPLLPALCEGIRQVVCMMRSVCTCSCHILSITGGMSVYERNHIQLAEKRKRKFSASCLPLKFVISILESGIRGSAVAPRTIYGALCRGKPAESEVFRGTLVKMRREASEGAHREEAEMFLDSVRMVGMFPWERQNS